MDGNGTKVREQAAAAVQDESYDKLFRSSAFGGFNKQDVLNYVERMSRNRRKETERYASHIKTVEDEKSALKTELGRLKTESADKDRQHADALSAAAKEADGLRGKVEELTRELEAERGAGAAHKAEYDRVFSRCETLESETAVWKEKAGRTEKLEEQLRLETAKAEKLEGQLEAAKAGEAEKAAARLREKPDGLGGTASPDAQDPESLAEKCAVLENKLREYELEKIRRKEIEEEAYRSARRIEAQAEERAQKLRGETEQAARTLLGGLGELDRELAKARETLQNELSCCDERYGALKDTVSRLSESVRRLCPCAQPEDGPAEKG